MNLHRFISNFQLLLHVMVLLNAMIFDDILRYHGLICASTVLTVCKHTCHVLIGRGLAVTISWW